MVITASLHSALISHDNYHISFAFWIAMTLPEYDQNPVVFVANLEEVKLEVLKLSIGMYRVLVCTTACFGKKWNHFFKTGLTCLGKIIKY